MSHWFEDIAPAFADLVRRAHDEHEAANFASDLALMGAKPHALRIMAARWRAGGFEPDGFAKELDALADVVAQVDPRDRIGAIVPIDPEHTPGKTYAYLVCVNGVVGFATDEDDAASLARVMRMG